MNDRDTFAAAALTGLLAQGDDADFPENTYWAAAYRMADAMLRERDNHIADAGKKAETPRSTRKSTGVADACATAAAASMGCDVLVYANHDAAPADGIVPDSRNWNEPTAWAVIERDGFGIEGLFPDREEAAKWCYNRQEIVPLYRCPQPTLTDEEREAVEAAIIGGCEMADTLRKLLERLK